MKPGGLRRRARFERRTALAAGTARLRRETWLRSINPERRARRRKAYQAFLKSAAWRRIRAQKLAEQPTCELRHPGCLVDQQLTVHHKTYIRFGGQELMQDLATACAPCHRVEDA